MLRIILDERITQFWAPHKRETSLPKKNDYITPLEPSAGYEIDENDSNPNARAKKLKKLDEQTIDIDKAKYAISIDSESAHLNAVALTIKGKSTFFPEFDPPGFYVHKFKEGALAQVERLRFQILFPSGVLESRPSNLGLAMGTVAFKTFYRADFPPPVAVEEPTSDLTKDWVWPELAVPNLESMQGIKAKFFFAPVETEGQDSQK